MLLLMYYYSLADMVIRQPSILAAADLILQPDISQTILILHSSARLGGKHSVKLKIFSIAFDNICAVS